MQESWREGGRWDGGGGGEGGRWGMVGGGERGEGYSHEFRMNHGAVAWG